MSKILSAKDKAFEQERIKFRTEINELKIKIKAQEQSINLAMEKVHKVENELAIYKDWVERLLDYCNMSEQELEELITKEKRRNEIEERVDALLQMTLNRKFF